jgi:hypothetical protein
MLTINVKSHFQRETVSAWKRGGGARGTGLGRKGGDGVGVGGKGGVMTQSLYVHMNKVKFFKSPKQIGY